MALGYRKDYSIMVLLIQIKKVWEIQAIGNSTLKGKELKMIH